MRQATLCIQVTFEQPFVVCTFRSIELQETGYKKCGITNKITVCRKQVQFKVRVSK